MSRSSCTHATRILKSLDPPWHHLTVKVAVPELPLMSTAPREELARECHSTAACSPNQRVDLLGVHCQRSRGRLPESYPGCVYSQLNCSAPAEVLPPLFYWQTVPTSCRHSEHLQSSALIVLEQGRSYNRCVAELHVPARTPGVNMALC